MQHRKLVSFSVYAALGMAAMVVWGGGRLAPVAGQSVRQDSFLYVAAAGEKNTDIFSSTPDGATQHNLTQSNEPELDPAWSPDGKRIVFALLPKPGERKSDIYVMNADGIGQMQLTTTQDIQEFGPQWTADGKRIIFTRMGGGDRKGQVWAMDAGGKNAKQLINNDAPCFFGSIGFFVLREGR